ncbi:MAG: hypothetical protein EBZ18_05870, partial [Alphaproteobacteria bacterium]|nr:hypothetical protein [Alphaproteobacteria bacterium]
IDNTDFAGIATLDENQLNNCRYDRLSPPRNLPVRITRGGVTGQVQIVSRRTGPRVTLPPPFQRDMDDPNSELNLHYTRNETLGFYKMLGDESNAARPKDRNGDPVPIVCPDDPNNPILGMTGDDEPTP